MSERLEAPAMPSDNTFYFTASWVLNLGSPRAEIHYSVAIPELCKVTFCRVLATHCKLQPLSQKYSACNKILLVFESFSAWVDMHYTYRVQRSSEGTCQNSITYLCSRPWHGDGCFVTGSQMSNQPYPREQTKPLSRDRSYQCWVRLALNQREITARLTQQGSKTYTTGQQDLHNWVARLTQLDSTS